MNRTFLIENCDGGIPTGTFAIWTLEKILREINRDSTCTDSNGNVCLKSECLENSSCCVMAGSPKDTLTHGIDCFTPYDSTDFQEGWDDAGLNEYYRIGKEVTV